MFESPLTLVRTDNFSSPQSQSVKEVMVVGAGIMGMTTAAILAHDGWTVTVIDPGSMHEGHVAAALTPVISSDDNSRSRLSRIAAIAAADWWKSLDTTATIPCGALQLQRSETAKRVTDLKAQVQAFGRPQWASWVDADQASEIAGLQLTRGGIWYPGGWLVRVPQLLEHLQKIPGVSRIYGRVHSICRSSGSWQVRDESGAVLSSAQAVVLANAFDALDLLRRSGFEQALAMCRRLPAMHRLAGEITCLPADVLGGGPRCVLGGDGYVLPATEGWCVSGGTYVRTTGHALCSVSGQLLNIDRAAQLLEREGLVEALAGSPLPGWSGWRAVLPGRLPAVGPLNDLPGCYVFTAGASRGLTWSVLGARLIMEALSGAAPSLDAQLLDAIAP